MVSTSRNISCPLAIMSSFSQNCLLLIPIMVSSSSEISLFLFPLGRKFICTSRVKNIEKYVSTIRKSCFQFKKSLKKLKKLVSLSRTMVRLSVIASTSRKNLVIKKQTKQIKPRCYVSNMFQSNEKLLPLVAVDCCLRKWKKMVSSSAKISFYQLKKIVC